MSDQRDKSGSWDSAAWRRCGRVLLAAFVLVFGLFLANVLVGKAQVVFAWRAPFLLDDVSEYLLLLAAALLFTLLALVRERQRDMECE